MFLCLKAQNNYRESGEVNRRGSAHVHLSKSLLPGAGIPFPGFHPGTGRVIVKISTPSQKMGTPGYTQPLNSVKELVQEQDPPV